MGYHIISVDNWGVYEKFLKEGYVGVRPIPPEKLSQSGMKSKIYTNWDIIADLKRVKAGDLIFIHVNGAKRIFGIFEAKTDFLEASNTPHLYKSKNLNICYWLENKKSWKRELDRLEKRNNYSPKNAVDYYWKIGISSVDNLYFEEGFDFREIFKLRSIGQIQSIPERFQYGDKPKAVKPILNGEAFQLIERLKRVNKKKATQIRIKANRLDSYRRIHLDVTPNNYGEVACEKIIEAYLMENIILKQNNKLEHQEVKKIIGDKKIEFYGNTIFTYYTNFIDVLIQFTEEPKNIVIELKKGKPPIVSGNLSAVEQLFGYMEWIKFYLEKGKYKNNNVKGILIASEYQKKYREWLSQTRKKDSIEFYKYECLKKPSDGFYLKFINVRP